MCLEIASGIGRKRQAARLKKFGSTYWHEGTVCSFPLGVRQHLFATKHMNDTKIWGAKTFVIRGYRFRY